MNMTLERLELRPQIARLLRVALAGLALLLSAGRANAACVDGYLSFWFELGNVCDTATWDCTGQVFTDLSLDQWVGMPNVVYEVRNSSDTATLVVGNADADGHYHACYSGSPSSVLIKFHPEESSGAYQVVTSSGGRWVWTASATGLGTGVNSRSYSIGSNGSPNSIASVYYSAYIELVNSVYGMPHALGSFTNVKIKMDRPTSDTLGYDKIVNIVDAIDSEMNNATVMHEMGHVASIMASRNQYMGPDNNNKSAGTNPTACGGDSSWSFTSSDECGDVVFMEATAEFLGAWARQGPDTTSPCTGRAGASTDCLSSGGLGLEQSPGSCTARDRVMDALLYLWDTYDARNDAISFGSYPAWEYYDAAFYHYPNGRSNHEKSENWCCTFWTCNPCAHDSKNILDYQYHLDAVSGVSTSSLNATNCL